jgi:protein-tyrosine phosphatase
MGYVDLHSHVLFGLDDGSPDRASSLAMLQGLAALGVTEQCATPHQRDGQYLPAWELVERTFAELVAASGPGAPALRLGAENMWDSVLHQRATARAIPCYAGTSTFLVELLPQLLPAGLLEALFRFRSEGQVPVLAHPERYQALWDDEALAQRVRQNCAFLVDLPAVAGFHGKREARAARRLLERGLATAVATDAHSLGDVQRAAEGLAWIDKHLGSAAIARLFDHAPRALLSGDLPD